MDEEDDPTCIIHMMQEFRANQQNYFRPPMLSDEVWKNNESPSKSKRSRFETQDESEIPGKKAKIETPQSRSFAKEVMSPWEVRRMKSEVLKSRAQVLEAHEEISKLNGLNKEMMIRYEKQDKMLKNQLEDERSKVKELESRLSFIRKREAEVLERYNGLKFGENEKENTAGKLLTQLQKENNVLQEKLFELENEQNTRKIEEENRTNVLNLEIETLKKAELMNIELVKDLRNELTTKSNELRLLEMEQTKFLSIMKRVKDLESEREAYLENKSLVETQNKKLMKYTDLEKELVEIKEENNRLKSSISNTLFLETVVEDLKDKLKIMDALEADVVRLQTECDNQRIELKKWSNLADHYCDSDTTKKPVTLVEERLNDLVKKELWYVSEHKDAEIRITHLREKVDELEKDVAKYKEQANCLKTSCETHAANIRRYKKQLHLVTWERNDLRTLLDSCQKDTTMASETFSLLDTVQKAIDGYKERAEQLSADPSIASMLEIDTKSSPGAFERDELQKKESLLIEENKKLKEKIQHLSDQLEYRHLKGDFDPRQTKIIHLKSNPTSEAVQQYEDKLTKANQDICKLRERIRVLEEGNDKDVTRIVEERVQSNSVKEIDDLKERIQSLGKQNLRLCEAFRKKSRDVRDAMYMLFGYKVDVLPDNQYRLCSLYAFDPQDTLLFQISETNNGLMDLLETSYSQTLNEMIDLHLKQHKSIPLFLASLTVDLFNKQTINSFSSTVEVSTCDG